MAFFGGSTGVIYRQFSVTIISAMMLSVVVALTSPRRCAALLSHSNRTPKVSSAPLTACGDVRKQATSAGCSAACAGRSDDGRLRVDLQGDGAGDVEAAGQLLPVEDRGDHGPVPLPAGATAVRTAEVRRRVTDWFLTKEKPIPTSFSPSTASALAAAARTPGWPSCR